MVAVKMTLKERGDVVFAFILKRWRSDPKAIVRHTAISARLDRAAQHQAGERSSPYFHAIGLARKALLKLNIALGTVNETPTRPGGYQLLDATEHYRRTHHRLDLALTRIDNERGWLESLVKRLDAKETAGLTKSEEILVRRFTQDLSYITGSVRAQWDVINEVRITELRADEILIEMAQLRETIKAEKHLLTTTSSKDRSKLRAVVRRRDRRIDSLKTELDQLRSTNREDDEDDDSE